MMPIDDRILQKAKGDSRFKAGEQQYYLGTFKERVLMTVSLADASQEPVTSRFRTVLNELLAAYPDLTVKISARLDDRWSVSYLKLAQEAGAAASLVEDGAGTSPFGLVLHTKEAVETAEIDIFARFPDLAAPAVPDQPSPKKGFWAKLFGQ